MKRTLSNTLWLAVLLCGWSGWAMGQTKFTISGTVKDAANGESLIGATVLAKSDKFATGAVTNAYGFYSLSLPEGTYTVTIQYVSFATQTSTVALKSNQTLNIELTDQAKNLTEVEVKGEKQDDAITRNQIGAEKLNIQSISTIPVLFGEKDVLKIIQLLPGVKSAGEGNSGFFVRGGASDQNLILLDEAPVYNASHLLGFFSVFNSDALKDATLYKGGIPAEYGGRLSSVLDIKMKEGNTKRLSVSGGIGLISSRLTVEGPIKKDRGSFIVSGRRTYADLFLKASPDSTLRDSKLYFYDLNAKANYKLNDKNWVYASGYFGTDKLGFGQSFGIDWGNTTGTLRWNHLYSSRLFSNTSLIYSNYRYNIGLGSGSSEIKISSRIKDWNLKQDFDYFANDRNSVKFGANLIYHTIIPGTVTTGSEAAINDPNLTNKYGWEWAAYGSHEHSFSDRFKLKYGLRLSGYSAVGPGTYYEYNPDRSIKNTIQYGSGEVAKTYINPEPRISFNYIVNNQSSIKWAYERNAQYLHLLSNSTATNPTDLWIPSSNNVKPQLADQVSVGYFRNFRDNQYELSAETYYKNLQNQIDYRNGAELRANENVEADLIYGDGRAYGLELSLKKKTGRFTGWVSYTLARTERRFAEVNNGSYFPARQDRTHDIALVGTYQLAPKLILSGNFIYYTGNAVTFPTGKYQLDGQTISLYSERNGYRMPNYHRLDLGLTWIRRKTDTQERSWNFSVYNAYGRENAYTVNFRANETDPSRLEAVQTSLFRWVPSVTYNFKF
ncbi:TonB-dependent receptor [Spirosoma montaniterrae]|uniref:Collagen-binding protein n=1 Tax=Spirosoma montaniterrae TaxID=1178516 RepID=A0A1P9X2B6_9BACT|nr:TonB-dependent receptor [Spirosoma montaniterrae]AQG81738.1 collagen-binding protein [Spirosoma montaniterrae]